MGSLPHGFERGGPCTSLSGRTFHTCLLKSGTPPERRCPKAYDHLRINVNVPNCALLSSHDDFSVVAMLPANVAVLTHIRDPGGDVSRWHSEVYPASLIISCSGSIPVCL